jgi:hypothetical protein
MRWLAILGAAVVIGAGAGTWIVLSSTPKPKESTSFAGVSRTPPPSSPSRFTGTASCSGRACHGSLEPSSDRTIIQGNEHTTWQVHDRHAEAYRVLFDDRSKRMVHALNLKTPAHETARCLACHAYSEIITDKSELTRTELGAGVGCETCHGAAGKWLGPHTAWGDLSADEKKDRYSTLGMTDLSGPRERAELCGRCHVGTGEYQVDHDLIAAGHPRLEFDLPAFLANMPPHWRAKDQEQAGEAVTWGIGQLVTARFALRLLAERADPDKGSAWPELAEYDCFACHHDLSTATWRRETDHFKEHSLGAVMWNRRYLTFLPELLDEDAKAPFADLGNEMGRPAPDRRKVLEFCRTLEKLIAARETKEKLIAARETKVFFATEAKRVLRELKDNPARFMESWDAAAQAYLATDALSRSSGQAETHPEVLELGKLLEFPRGTDSPARFRADKDLDQKLKSAISQAGKAALGKQQ